MITAGAGVDVQCHVARPHLQAVSDLRQNKQGQQYLLNDMKITFPLRVGTHL